jgi:hypothetical protein
MMANRSDRRLLTLFYVRAHQHEAVGMSTRTSCADFHQGPGSCTSSLVEAGYMTATVFAFALSPLHTGGVHI